MFKQIIKIIWFHRKNNCFIFCELLVVLAIVWTMVDSFIVEYNTWHLPLGFDITNTHRLKLANLPVKAVAYVPEEERTTTESEDLQILMERIRRQPEVEEVCATFYSCPYSNGNSQRHIRTMDSGDAEERSGYYQLRRVTPEYFTVFQVKDKNGEPVSPLIEKGVPAIILSRELEKLFYEGQEGKGNYVKVEMYEISLPVAGVSANMRMSDYEISEPCFFEVMQGENYKYYTEEMFHPSQAELCVRMKQPKTAVEMQLFLENMGDQLTVNNLYVEGSVSFREQRQMKIQRYENDLYANFKLMLFLLLNVFFGIVGTFWIQMRKRRNEIGLRIALGSSRRNLFKYMNMEGIALLFLTIPFLLFFSLTMIQLDIPDSYRLPFTPVRFVLSFGITYLLVAGMICLGISFPAWKAMKMEPAEALHYE